MVNIYDKHERILYDKLKKYVKLGIGMYKVPTEQLYNLRRDFDSFIVSQSPYINSVGRQQWSDFSVYVKSMYIDIRIEVMSLECGIGALKNKPYEIVRESKNIPENHLVVVLLNDGYDDNKLLFGLKAMIKTENYPVSIITSLEQFDVFLEHIFAKKIMFN